MIRILNLVREALPTHRPDISVLFSAEAVRHGYIATNIGLPADAGPRPGGVFLTSPWHRRRVVREAAHLLYVLRQLLGRGLLRHEIVQVRDMATIGLIALVIARLRGRRFVYWMSFLMSEGRVDRARLRLTAPLPRGQRLRAVALLAKGQLEGWLLYHVIIPNADLLVVQSEAMRAYVLNRATIAPSRVLSMPMGVSMAALRESTGDLSVSDHARSKPSRSVVYLGSLDGERRIDVLLDALSLLRRDGVDARLVLIGSSANASDLAALEDGITRRGLSGIVERTGWLPTRQAWRRLMEADLAVSYVPRSRVLDVSSPTKLLEYLALGMPCVANDSPDQREVLTASGAGILCASDVESVARALTLALRDLPAARARAARGPDYIRAHRDYEVLAQRLGDGYRSIAA